MVANNNDKFKSAWYYPEFIDENGEVSKDGWERIMWLTWKVIRRHFPPMTITKDLFQIGVTCAGEAVKRNPENGKYRNFKTYLYTCIRNEISNYLYHTHKRVNEDGESLKTCKVKFSECEFDHRYIDAIFSKLPARFEKYRPTLEYIVYELSCSPPDEYQQKSSDHDSNDSVDMLSTLYADINVERFERIKDEGGVPELDLTLLCPTEKKLMYILISNILRDIRR